MNLSLCQSVAYWLYSTKNGQNTIKSYKFMKIRKVYYYLMLIAGAALVIYIQSSSEQQYFMLILGFCLLMAGLYGIYSSIKEPKPEFDPFAVKNDEEE